ncbi:META domain-containing protein [Algoriphagus sp. D3-2-R+10]|uniref:META domain-containing protein n=1 Tax=Algoriphagus aurantiacus TaxID=3103948 RepID=UPI002B3A13F4|nr:META domain-containing protein [Algoriphagus sp. D3-2-R+10]MEB2775735.1 META domain-containing protein [Algoriphagus sp. D3-2-R+10]
MRAIKTLSIGLIFLLFTSCAGNKAINPLNLLTGNTWALSSLMGTGLDMNQFAGGIPTLSFLDGGNLAGFSGCNNFSGNFSLEGTGIKLDPGAMTKKMCPGTGEQDFISALSKVGDLEIGKDKLTLLDGSTELMSFVPKKE